MPKSPQTYKIKTPLTLCKERAAGGHFIIEADSNFPGVKSRIGLISYKPHAEQLIEAFNDTLERTCVYCGCTESRACAGGCTWVEKHAHTPTGVCSQCATRENLGEGVIMLRITLPISSIKSRLGKLSVKINGLDKLKVTKRC